MRTRRIAATGVLFSLLWILIGCQSAAGYYQSGLKIVRTPERPGPDEVTRAHRYLDKAIERAKKELDSDRVSRSDATAYVIPLARIAKARLHRRFEKTTDMERECWQAIHDAEEYLGAHIHKIKNDVAEISEDGEEVAPTQPPETHKQLGASVFFRREKIRRHAFALLLGVYRDAGEKNLESLMQAQIGFSDSYLRSSVAHGEELFIREIENSHWRQKYDLSTAGVRHNLSLALLFVAQAATAAAGQKQMQDLDESAANNPRNRSYVEQRKAQIREQQRKNMEQFKKAAKKLKEAHQRQTSGIRTSHSNTVAGALAGNFELVGVSEEIRQLDAYFALRDQKEKFDDYVTKRGFDQNAADALIDLRTSLDELTREVQKQRMSEKGSNP